MRHHQQGRIRSRKNKRPGGKAPTKKGALPRALSFVADAASGRQRLGVAQRGGVEAAVHVHDFAGDAAGEVGEQEGDDVADFFDGDIAAQRRVVRVVGQQLAELPMPEAPAS